MALVVKQNEAEVFLSGDFLSPDDQVSIQKCRAELKSIVSLSSGKSLQINLDELKVVSSVVLSILLCLRREANKVSCTLAFVNMSQGLFDMARVGGVESLFPSVNH